jgi:hypothetical protein
VAEVPVAEAPAEAPAVAEPSTVEAAEVAPVVAGLAAISAAEPEAAAEEEKTEPAEEAKGVEPFVTAAPEAETKGIAPVVALDPDRARDETKRLLDGEPYDRGLLATRDAMARQMIAAELLSALSGRNAERRERARAAFTEHGYFNEKVEDLRSAQAAAERASAARALALASDRAATPHLVVALEDEAVEVRRAAVESLASLRDPAAVAPLEALLRREKKSKTKVNRKLVEHAVETCRAGVAEAPPTPAVTEAAIAEPAEAAQVEEVTAVQEAATETARAPVVEQPTTEPSAEPVEKSAAVEAVAEPSFLVEEPVVEEAAPEAAPVADEVEPAVSAEVAEPRGLFERRDAVEEVAAVEETPAEDETPTLVAEAETVEVARPALFEEASPAVEEETVEVEAAEAAPPVGLVEAVPAVEEVEAAQEPAPAQEAPASEEETLTAVGADAEPSVEELPSPVEEVAAESALVEEEVAESVAADDAAAEEPAPRLVAPSADAAEGAAPRRAGQAADWVEFDMGELSDAAPAASAEPAAETFETTAVEPFAAEPHEHKRAAAEPFVFESSAGEPVAREYGADETALVEAPADEAPRAHEAHEAFAAPFASPAGPAEEKGVALFDEYSAIPASIQQRLASREPEERAAAVAELGRVDTSEAFQQLCAAFDDDAKEVRSAAARALYDMQGDRADTFTRALREASPERRRNIGAAISTSGLASDAISQLTGESREKTYEAFSLLFLMAKAGEVAPLVRAIEAHPNNEVRLAVVKLLALSGQKEILPAFRRLAVRGSLPTEVRSAVMEAIYQISSQSETTTPAA